MKLQFVERLRERLRHALTRRLVWVTSDRRDFHGTETDVPAFVVVVGREHYDERRQQYPIRSWLELSRILRLERPDASSCLAVIGPVLEDRREVTFFDLHPQFVARSGQAAFWIPESLLLSACAERGQVATVERDGIRYFLAHGATSQRAGGLVRSPELFAFAGGIPQDNLVVWNEASELRERMRGALGSLDVSVWLRCVSPTIKDFVRAHWKPVAALASITMVAYLVLASVYLQGMNWWRERQIAALGSEVSVLLESQRRSDRLATEQRGAAKVLEGRRPTYFVWRVAAKVWEQGGSFEGLSWSDDQLLLRGRTPNAIELLKTISALPGVEGARFAAPVTDDAGLQSFAIKLKLAGEGA